MRNLKPAAWMGLLAIGLGLTAAPARVVASEEASDGSPVSVRGLQVTVVPSKTSWAIGELMRLEATLKNVSDKPFLVDVFGELDGLYWGKRRSSYVTSCWALTWPRQAVPIGPRGEQAKLAPDQFIRLGPGDTHSRRLFLKLSDIEAGTYRLRLAYTPRAATPAFSFPDRWEEQQGFSEAMWIGMAFSDPFTIQIVAAPPNG